ncbi:MAG: type II toxin-antitoxin system VapC family toxin [Nitrososphaerota archaeon]|nr:type II toxin-antitoxin system VapC family toxin [Nitrososphaerota archaeon]
MIVADSSFIAEGILADRSLIRSELMLSPSLAVYEVAGAVWKHQALLGRIREGDKFLAVLSDLLATRRLLTVEPDRELIMDAHRIAVRHGAHPNDAVFVAVALKSGLELRTFDAAQRKVFEDARSGRGEGA